MLIIAILLTFFAFQHYPVQCLQLFCEKQEAGVLKEGESEEQ